MFQLKRVYDPPSEADGLRILVDRLWPRGLSKEKAALDSWLKDLAPSPELRQWFNHDAAKWKQFQSRYKKELSAKADLLKALAAQGRGHKVTLLYGARDTEHNEAVVLKQVLTHRVRKNTKGK
jgi:uncharacterized protein YeaO (DUF488 family)